MPHLTNSVIGDPRVNDQEWAKREGMVGFAGYPLLVDRRVIGVIAMFTRQPIPAAIFEAMASGANEIAVGIDRKVAEERARQNFNRIRALHEIDRAITSTLDLPSVFAVILNSIVEFFPCATAIGIALRNHDTGALEAMACRGMVFEEWQRAFFTGDSFINAAALRGPLVITDLRADPRFVPAHREFIEKSGHKSSIVVPIKIDNRILGLMGFATSVKCNFSNNEIEFLTTLAGQVAVAIQNVELYEETKKQHLALIEQERIQRILKELSQDITRMDVDTLLDKLTGTIREVFKVEIAEVRFLAGGQWSNVIIADENLVQHLLETRGLPRGASAWVIKNRKPIAIYDYLEQTEFAPGRVTSRFGVRGFLAAPLLSKSGEVIGVIRALSKQPRTFTAQEINLFEQLANGAAIAIENEKLYKNLEKSNKIKSEFLSVMSHELRTPINIIMGYAAVVKEDLLREANEAHSQSLQKIESQAANLLAMTNAIMQATEIESGSAAVARQQVDIGELLNGLKSQYGVLRGKNLILIWQAAERLPVLTTDYTKLKHILQNLIDNAIKFTDNGTVTIAARLAEEREASLMKRISSAPASGATPDEIRAARYLEVTVGDTGIGMPKEELASIFDIFKQMDSSTTRAYQGAGLGLYIAKKYCELIGGEIHVESEIGKGSTFTVALPLA
jgi:signal transduction histidine kinase